MTYFSIENYTKISLILDAKAMHKKDNEFIDALGGVTKVARICGITRGAVSQWRQRGIPKAQRNYLRTLHKEMYLYVFHERANQ